MTEKRLDKVLIDRKLVSSRVRAQQIIEESGVLVNGKLITKTGKSVPEDAEIQLISEEIPWVSKGALKLLAAIEHWKISCRDKSFIDLGASTGGFTDFTLQHGAKKVLALDVGKGQLHYKLQHDSRVVNLEGINFRNFSLEDLIRVLDDVSLEKKTKDYKEHFMAAESNYSHRLDFIVSDLSFISLTKVADKILEIAKHFNPRIVLLLKPQFEASKEIADKFRGIITDEKIRDEIIKDLLEKLSMSGLQLKEMIESPIKGTKGNVEYLAEFGVLR